MKLIKYFAVAAIALTLSPRATAQRGAAKPAAIKTTASATIADLEEVAAATIDDRARQTETPEEGLVSPALPLSPTPAALELYRMNSLWMQSLNAGGAMIDNPQAYGTLEAGYRWISGDFRRPQQGAKDNRLNIATEGSAILPHFFAWGRFDYSRDNIEKANYNMSITDPYRGMPYYSMDLVPSPWRNQYYDMQFRLATPKWRNGLSFGLDGNYTASSAAKQYDIRTANYSMRLQVRPGVVYTSGGHSAGANFNYYTLREDAKNSMLSDREITYYTLRGLGVATFTTVTSAGRVTNYVGNNVGGAVQYGYHGSSVNLLFSLAYDHKVEDVYMDWTMPRNDGTVIDRIWKAHLMLNYRRTYGLLSHHFDLNYTDRDIKGIEYVLEVSETGWAPAFSSVRSKYHTQTASFNYALVASRGDEYSWKAEAGAHYEKQDDRYLLPVSLFNVEKLRFNLAFKKNFNLGDTYMDRLLVEIGSGLNVNLSGEYLYTGVRPSTPPVTGLMFEDASYLMTHYWNGKASVTYSRKMRKDRQVNLFTRADLNYTQALDSYMDHRTFVRISVGCNF